MDSKFKPNEKLLPGQYEIFIKNAVDLRRKEAIESIADLSGHLVIYRENLFVTGKVVLSCGCQPDFMFRYKVCAERLGGQ